MPTELILRNYIITSQLAARPNRGAKRRSNGGTSDSKTPRVRFAAPFPRVETRSEITSSALAIRKFIANACEKVVRFSSIRTRLLRCVIANKEFENVKAMRLFFVVAQFFVFEIGRFEIRFVRIKRGIFEFHAGHIKHLVYLDKEDGWLYFITDRTPQVYFVPSFAVKKKTSKVRRSCLSLIPLISPNPRNSDFFLRTYFDKMARNLAAGSLMSFFRPTPSIVESIFVRGEESGHSQASPSLFIH